MDNNFVQLSICSGRIECLIDTDDFDRVSKRKWNLNSNGYVRKTQLISCNPKKYKTILLHRFILNIDDPKIKIDHINGNKLDNRKTNLRLCSQNQNLRNRHKMSHGLTQYKGVHFDSRLYSRPWFARSIIDSLKIDLGGYTYDILAAQAVDLLHIYLRDDFQLLNFPKKYYEGINIEEFITKHSSKSWKKVKKDLTSGTVCGRIKSKRHKRR